MLYILKVLEQLSTYSNQQVISDTYEIFIHKE